MQEPLSQRQMRHFALLTGFQQEPSDMFHLWAFVTLDLRAGVCI